jgi:hypothetical protein
MSPDAYVCYDKSRRLLCGFPGQSRTEEPTFIWTYSVFEDLVGESITPSMYYFFIDYVEQQLTKDELWEIQSDEYGAGDLEAAAVDAYFDLPIRDRIRMHEQTLVNLRAEKREAEAKESAAIDAMLTENKPFDHTSPIDAEYCDFMRGIIAKARKTIEQVEEEMHEEEQWRGGHEEGASDTEQQCYDPMDE